jgi:hypothetical protein
MITEIYFNKFDQFKEREYQGLLDYSKLAWRDGKKTSYVLPDSGKIVYLDVDPIDYTEAEYGIFVALSGKQAEKKQKLEAQMQNFIQNGAKASTIVDIINSDSFVELKQKFIYAEQQAEQMQQQMEQQKQQAAAQQQEQALAAQDAMLDKKHAYDVELLQMKIEGEIRKAEMTAFAIDEGSNADAIQKTAELALKQQELGIKQQDLGIKDKAINAKSNEAAMKLSVEKEKMVNDLKIAKENKSR